MDLNGYILFQCPDGYEPATSGNQCENINECELEDHGCEKNCTDTLGSFTCVCDEDEFLALDGKNCLKFICPAGFELSASGTECENINECVLDDIDCEKNCTDTNGSYACTCDFGEILDEDGKNCHPLIDSERCQFSWWSPEGRINSCYMYSTPNLTADWGGARNICAENSMNLLAFETEEEYQFIAETTKDEDYRLLWTGANKLSGSWEWEGLDLPVSSSFWKPGRPDGSGDCGYVYHDSRIFDYGCENIGVFICEFQFN
ncbi:hypothetical protein CAPTEDRAFT_202941 [Capitella teleta]|uniref:C-type lectin domain-containing protein n=1 Tax=Capitella teleta TaxID=283909 RepID=R7U0C0_CAPTE|nr:hypothetical protein CAPTEDRAFT_202941 [Capitella teleta]|eukprot:ELT99429.1 hypothetical protein CAPTEDRAFT_202941 [Capitella teleta]